MKKPEIEFDAPELDQFLVQWIESGLSEAELKEWKQILTYDTEFRAQFCEWIKALREPAWSKVSNSGSMA